MPSAMITPPIHNHITNVPTWTPNVIAPSVSPAVGVETSVR